MTTEHGRVLNLKRSLPDARDWQLVNFIKLNLTAQPPADNHLRVIEPPIEDQGQLGSCTGFGSERAFRMASKVQGYPDVNLSAMFQYFNERKDQGTIGQDSGASIRESIQALANYGICDEALWPYTIANFTAMPSAAAYADAAKRKAIKYYAVTNDPVQVKAAILAGFVVTVGISVYSSFETNNGGQIPMPVSGEAMLGGHNIVLDSYDDISQRYGFANSWGTGWGQAGFGTIPYAYIQALGFDLWAIEAVTSPSPQPTPVPPTPTPVPPTPTPVPPSPTPTPNPTTPRDQLLKATLPSTGWLTVGQYGQYGAEIRRRDGTNFNPRIIIPDLRKSVFGPISTDDDLDFERFGWHVGGPVTDLAPDSPLRESQR